MDSIAYPPRGLSRLESARYVGIGTTLFDAMVTDGRMPKPRNAADSDGEEDMMQLDICPECNGEGYFPEKITVYEHGCGFPHDDIAEHPCPMCGGAGTLAAPAKSDMERALELDGEKLLHLTGEDHGPF